MRLGRVCCGADGNSHVSGAVFVRCGAICGLLNCATDSPPNLRARPRCSPASRPSTPRSGESTARSPQVGVGRVSRRPRWSHATGRGHHSRAGGSARHRTDLLQAVALRAAERAWQCCGVNLGVSGIVPTGDSSEMVLLVCRLLTLLSDIATGRCDNGRSTRQCRDRRTRPPESLATRTRWMDSGLDRAKRRQLGADRRHGRARVKGRAAGPCHRRALPLFDGAAALRGHGDGDGKGVLQQDRSASGARLASAKRAGRIS